MSDATLLSVLDNGGETFDRYTISILYGDESCMFGASENPFHPQGFGMYVGDGGFPNTEENPDVGLPVEFSDLPKDVQKYIDYLLTT